jgi:4-amino-4-deoxy-L-arabinose transferase-like glycosyltransferase
VNSRRALILLILLSGIVGLSFQGSRGLYESTEGRYAEVAREMLTSGHYLEPTLEGKPHWTKPPITYWTIAAGLRVFGQNEWGARIFSVVAFVLTVVAVVSIGKTLWDDSAGIAAGFIYATYVFTVAAAAALSTDTLLTLFEVLGVLAYVRAYRTAGTSTSKTWVCMMWLAFGLAFSTKGPPALLPLVALIVFHWHAGRPFRAANGYGIAIFLVTGFWWYGLEVLRHPQLIRYFIGDEIVGRNLKGEFHRHSQWYAPFTVYLPAIVFGQGFWLYYGARMLHAERLLQWAGIKARVRSRGAAGVFLLIWFLVPLLIFSLAKSRLPLYVVPLFPPMALATGRWLAIRWRGEALARVGRIAAVTAIVIVIVKGVAAVYPSDKNMAPLFEAAQKAGGKDAEYLLFREQGLHGFQFYARGAARRVSVIYGQPWADQDLKAVIADLNASEQTHAAVFVSAPNHEQVLLDRLSAAGVPYSVSASGRWKLVVVRRE